MLENKWEWNEAEHRLFINFKNAYVSLRREELYNTLTESRIPMKLVRVTKMCLNETQTESVKANMTCFPLRVV